MIKDFEIKDILSAVNSISKIERKKRRTMKVENDSNDEVEILPLNNQVKSNKSEVLVLNQMIE